MRSRPESIEILAAKDEDEPSRRAIEIEDRIAGMVPRSAAGAVAQLGLLRQWGEFDWGEAHEKLVANLIAGLERFG